MDKMEKIVEQSLLYDFYGELLTEHQRQVYEDAVFNDMSMTEIASEHGISRQGVHDMLKRCNHILEGYEAKLHLVERFLTARTKVAEIRSLTAQFREEPREEILQKIEQISSEILEEL